MKKQLLTVVLAVTLIGNSYIANAAMTAAPDMVIAAQTQGKSMSALSDMDMQAAFQQDAQPMQLAALSGREMTATQGAWAWMLPFATALFAVNYVWGKTTNSQQDKKVSNNIGTIGKSLCVVHPGSCISWLK